MRKAGKVVKVQGSNNYQLPKQKNTSNSIRLDKLNKSAIFQTDSFQKWIKKKKNKHAGIPQVRFARICLGLEDPKFKIHPDNITRDNWREIVTSMVDVLLESYTNPEYGEPPYNTRQAIRGFIQESLEINISQVDGENLRISGRKPKEHMADLHIRPLA